jgi:hypothetical protein
MNLRVSTGGPMLQGNKVPKEIGSHRLPILAPTVVKQTIKQKP